MSSEKSERVEAWETKQKAVIEEVETGFKRWRGESKDES